MGKSKRLKGEWIKKDDPNVTLFISNVYKKGYATGVASLKINGVIQSDDVKVRITHDELLNGYEKVKYS